MFEHFPELVKDIDTGNTTYTMKDEKTKNPCTFRHNVMKQLEHQKQTAYPKRSQKEKSKSLIRIIEDFSTPPRKAENNRTIFTKW